MKTIGRSDNENPQCLLTQQVKRRCKLSRVLTPPFCYCIKTLVLRTIIFVYSLPNSNLGIRVQSTKYHMGVKFLHGGSNGVWRRKENVTHTWHLPWKSATTFINFFFLDKSSALKLSWRHRSYIERESSSIGAARDYLK